MPQISDETWTRLLMAIEGEYARHSRRVVGAWMDATDAVAVCDCEFCIAVRPTVEQAKGE